MVQDRPQADRLVINGVSQNKGVSTGVLNSALP